VFTDYYGKELWTIPNIITYTRMFSSPFLGLAIVYDYKTAALAGCSIAAFSDWLDGYIAKNYNQMTVLGGMIDPAADKLMIGCLTAGIAWKGLLPVELCALIVGRDVFLLGCSFALRAMERPTGTPFFDTTYSATFEIIPSNLSKFNTIMQFGLLAGTLCNWGIAGGLPPILAQGLEPLQYVTAATTLGSLVGYLDGSAIKRLSPSGVRRGRGEDESERDVAGVGVGMGVGAAPADVPASPSPSPPPAPASASSSSSPPHSRAEARRA
jgi:cardiolipin synthase